MASYKTISTAPTIQKITVRKRKDETKDEKRPVRSLNLISTTSSSPSSPRRIRVIGTRVPRSILRSPSKECNTEVVVCDFEAERDSAHVPSNGIVCLLKSVVNNLWNRDGDGEEHTCELNRAQATALWYLCESMAAVQQELPFDAEIPIALAAVFLTFKAADFIPGIGRVKMHQLMNAYIQASGAILSEHQTSRLIEQICKSEMDIMCLTDFNFSPVK
jgi:hypothetical protein